MSFVWNLIPCVLSHCIQLPSLKILIWMKSCDYFSICDIYLLFIVLICSMLYFTFRCGWINQLCMQWNELFRNWLMRGFFSHSSLLGEYLSMSPRRGLPWALFPRRQPPSRHLMWGHSVLHSPMKDLRRAFVEMTKDMKWITLISQILL